MRTFYSKPLGDVAKESRELLAEDQALLTRERALTRLLSQGPRRRSCMLCLGPLDQSPVFRHREAEYVRCSTCGHILTARELPRGYPFAHDESCGFDAIYPDLTPEQLEDRRRRIYEPKLRWIIESAAETGLDRQTLVSRKWLEFGSGGGQFLASLEELGVRDATGLEADANLAERSRRLLRRARVEHSRAPLAQAVKDTDADIYAAFFVFEHVDDLHELFTAFRTKRPGTLLAFSVPVFSMATVMESAFKAHSARNLDGVIHTQLFTDDSISRCLDTAGFTPVSQWIFGQDADDLHRVLVQALADCYPQEILREIDQKLRAQEDPLQAVLDQSHFSDARHILAIRS
jgi:hypothetical protein